MYWDVLKTQIDKCSTVLGLLGVHSEVNVLGCDLLINNGAIRWGIGMQCSRLMVGAATKC